TFYLPGEDSSSQDLREGWEYNNLDSESKIMQREKLILGRGFVSVGSNEDDEDNPLIQVESPREMSVSVNPRFRRIDAAARFTREEVDIEPSFHVNTHATLMMPYATVWCERTSAGWVEIDRDPHGLGRVP